MQSHSNTPHYYCNSVASFFCLFWAIRNAIRNTRYLTRTSDKRRHNLWEENIFDSWNWKRSISAFRNTKNLSLTPLQCGDIHVAKKLDICQAFGGSGCPQPPVGKGLTMSITAIMGFPKSKNIPFENCFWKILFLILRASDFFRATKSRWCL